MMKANLGFIGGVIAQELKSDFWGAMGRIAAMGFKGLEGGDVLLRGDVKENLRRLSDLGMKVITLGASRQKLMETPDELIENARQLGAVHLTNWWGPVESKEQILKDAELYNAVGRKAASAGLKLLYHHHDHELLTQFDRMRALDLLARSSDPACLQLNLDTAWLVYGGVDPVAYLRRYAGRVPVLHLKDIADVYERGKFCAVGAGCVPVRACVETALAVGVNWVVYEQDRPHVLSGFEAAQASVLNLREMGLV